LFGGSFDPVHKGHLHAARAARERFGLDRVVFMPALHPPHKAGDELAPAADRCEMIARAITGLPGLEVSTLELERAGPSFTIDTVRGLRPALHEPEQAEIYLVLGSDNLASLGSWKAARELLLETIPIVILRPGDEARVPPQLSRTLGSSLSARLERGFLPLPPAPGASRELRARLASGERNLPELPAAVEAYIIERGLYGTAD
jgi:nicotinate-nucleotide adenylyltransferase